MTITTAGILGGLRRGNGAFTAQLSMRIVGLGHAVRSRFLFSFFSVVDNIHYADSVEVGAQQTNHETGLQENTLLKPYRKSSIILHTTV